MRDMYKVYSTGLRHSQILKSPDLYTFQINDYYNYYPDISAVVRDKYIPAEKRRKQPFSVSSPILRIASCPTGGWLPP
jgi:hypothetical protein